MKEHCCEMMDYHCREMPVEGHQTDAQVTYLPRFHEFGLPCADGSSHIVIRYCPWCGRALQPWDLRDRWFADKDRKRRIMFA